MSAPKNLKQEEPTDEELTTFMDNFEKRDENYLQWLRSNKSESKCMRYQVIVEGVFIVGMHHCQVRELQVGEGFILKRDIHNRFDDHAVAVLDVKDCKTRRAFIWKGQSRFVSEILDICRTVVLKVRKQPRKSIKGAMQESAISMAISESKLEIIETVIKKRELNYMVKVNKDKK